MNTRRWVSLVLLLVALFGSAAGLIAVLDHFGVERLAPPSWSAPPCPGHGEPWIVVQVQSINDPDPEEAMNGLDAAGWSNITYHMGRGMDSVVAECPQERGRSG